MESFICRPERNAPHPAVFFLMDAHGIREELRDMARRLATVGYYVLLPNLYYRAGRDTIFGPDVLQEGSTEHTRMRAVRTQDDHPAGDARYRCHARVYRSSGRRHAGPGGLSWLLYERPVRVGGGGTLSRLHRCCRLVLRHVARQRGGGESASLTGPGQGRTLYCLCRA